MKMRKEYIIKAEPPEFPSTVLRCGIYQELKQARKHAHIEFARGCYKRVWIIESTPDINVFTLPRVDTRVNEVFNRITDTMLPCSKRVIEISQGVYHEISGGRYREALFLLGVLSGNMRKDYVQGDILLLRLLLKDADAQND